MTIAGVCPECGAARPVSEFLADARERQALEAALRLDPRLADALLGYLALFAPPGKKLQSRKLVRLLTELQEMVGCAEVSIERASYAAPVEYWRRGMEQMLANRGSLSLPLASHGYLKKVVAGIASKAAGAGEQRREEALRSPSRRAEQSDGGCRRVGDVLTKTKAKTQRTPPPPGWKDQVFKPGKINGETDGES